MAGACADFVGLYLVAVLVIANDPSNSRQSVLRPWPMKTTGAGVGAPCTFEEGSAESKIANSLNLRAGKALRFDLYMRHVDNFETAG